MISGYDYDYDYIYMYIYICIYVYIYIYMYIYMYIPSMQNHRTRRLDPRTSRHLVELEGSPARAWRGPTVGPPGAPGAKKNIFSKVVPRTLGMLKQVFLASLEPVLTRFGPWKFPKCLDNGPF